MLDQQVLHQQVLDKQVMDKPGTNGPVDEPAAEESVRRGPAPGEAAGDDEAVKKAAVENAVTSTTTGDTPAEQLLVVEDEPELRAALARALRSEGYQVEVAPDGRAAAAVLPTLRPDALVLDVLMPYVNGLDLCRSLRAAGDRTPVLMLTARDAVADRVAGLDAGADDYLVKPFALEELFARIRALLRRSRPDEDEDPTVLTFDDLRLDRASHTVHRDGDQLDLTRTEFALLELLILGAGTVLTREVILDRIWGYEFSPGSNSLEVFIGYLRRKTETGGRPRLVHTVRGVGYVLREP